jgi:4-alpha-glucanotransferase
MTGDRALLRLARLAGVAPSYEDAWHKQRQVAPETLRRILGAMGIAASDDRDVADSLARFHATEGEALLPPVATATAETASSVPVAVGDREDGRLHWSIALETGEHQEGAVRLAALPVLEQASDGAGKRRRVALPLDRALPVGYHRLSVVIGSARAETLLIIAPRRGHLGALAEARSWGVTAQLYGLRSTRNWGIGDFGDLAALAQGVARQGARALGINPLHALFPATPRMVSPYSPSSRLFVNPLYLDVTAVPDFAESTAAQAWLAAPETENALAAARGSALVDYERVAALKRAAFAMLHRSFAERHLGAGEAARTARGAAFRRFQQEGGRSLLTYATFTALHEHRVEAGAGGSWHDWPAPLRDAASPEVGRFAAGHRERIELHQYLQWEADRQLGVAARAGTAAGLSLGLYRDLAVGVDPSGADAWADPSLMVGDATVGAPPDILNMKGQDWGLAPFNPVMLRRQAYAPFIAALRASMRHSGVLRIDHAMGLRQLYWVPRGLSAADGAYVAYPLDDLRRILALESRRQRCAVIAEDLGTVPRGFTETMRESGVLSYRLLVFERDEEGGFLPPEEYPEFATASFSTHDIATLRGFWTGRDLEWRRKLDLYPSEGAAGSDAAERRRDRRRLLAALIAAGALSRSAAERLLPGDGEPVWERELAEAVHLFLARTPSLLVLMQLENALQELEQPNLPGTVDEHPNWRRRLPLSLERLLHDPLLLRLAAILAQERSPGKSR